MKDLDNTVRQSVTTTGTDVEGNRRKAIIDFACNIAHGGAHYLWGSFGDRPPASGSFADVNLSTGAYGDATFCAATTSVRDGPKDAGGQPTVQKYVCAGRFNHKDVAGRLGFPPRSGAPPVTPPTPGPIAIPQNDENLKNFVELYQRNHGAQVGWDSRLTPRKMSGNVIWYGHNNMPLNDCVVWGEGCDDTLHFDCNSFIRYVFNHVCGLNLVQNWQVAALETLTNPWGGKIASLVSESTGANPEYVLPGDVFVYEGHTALALAKTRQEYKRSTHYSVVQAESGTEGVNDYHDYPKANTKCLRLTASTLLGRAP
ncbi:MAG TPA: hypothetical protein VJO52_09655 [Gemmatimonadaceae bacterium]|nr:hypothetical protein [Gemmatimonadaceae bacterium]